MTSYSLCAVDWRTDSLTSLKRTRRCFYTFNWPIRTAAYSDVTVTSSSSFSVNSRTLLTSPMMMMMTSSMTSLMMMVTMAAAAAVTSTSCRYASPEGFNSHVTRLRGQWMLAINGHLPYPLPIALWAGWPNDDRVLYPFSLSPWFPVLRITWHACDVIVRRQSVKYVSGAN